MIDSRFSAAAFTRADDDATRTLANELQVEVTTLLAPVIRAKLGEIADLLNERGHQLSQAFESGEGGVCFESPSDATIRLYVCHVSVVSAGTRAV